MGNYSGFYMFENPRRGRQATNFTTNVPKILDLKSSSEQIFSQNCRWVPLQKSWPLWFLCRRKSYPALVPYKIAGGVWKIKLECLCKRWQVSYSLRMKKKTVVVKVVIQTSVFFRCWGAKWNKCDKCYEFHGRLRDNHTTVPESLFIPFLTELKAVLPKINFFS